MNKMGKKQQWYYKDQLYCRPILTYEEVDKILYLMENDEDSITERKTYLKFVRCKNTMNEKRLIDEK